MESNTIIHILEYIFRCNITQQPSAFRQTATRFAIIIVPDQELLVV